MQRNRSRQNRIFCQADSGPAVTRGASGNHLSGFSGNSAAVRAGRKLADPAAVDQAVMREVRRFEAARTRMRAALIPYITAAS